MNRREFLRGATAAGLAPMVPLGAVTSAAQAATASAAPAAAAGNFLPYMYDFAVQHARTAGEVSAGSLSNVLGVQPDMARAITSRLVKKGVVGVPNAFGVSRAINPFRPTSASMNGSTNSVLNTNPYRKAKDAVDDVLERIDDTTEKLEKFSETDSDEEQKVSEEELSSETAAIAEDDRSDEALDDGIVRSEIQQDEEELGR